MGRPFEKGARLSFRTTITKRSRDELTPAARGLRLDIRMHGDEDFSFKGPKWTMNISFSRELNEACQKNSGQLNQQSILGEIRLPRREHFP